MKKSHHRSSESRLGEDTLLLIYNRIKNVERRISCYDIIHTPVAP